MKRIVVLGAGESGAGAAVLAKKEGFDVFVSDMSKIADRYKQMLDDRHIEWEEGQHTEEKILSADEIIKSPGIPDTAPMVSKAIAKGIKIISEIEFAGRYTDSKMICITGSNGKTTTTSLIYHIFRQAGYDVVTFNADHESDSDKPLFTKKNYGDYPYVHVKVPHYVGNGLRRMYSIFKFAWSIYRHAHDFERPDVILHNVHAPFDFPVVLAA